MRLSEVGATSCEAGLRSAAHVTCVVIDVNCEGPYEFLERWGQDGSEWAVDLESALSKVYKHCASEAHRDVSRGHRGSDRFVLSLKSPSGPAFSLSFHQSTHPRPLTVVVSCSLSALSVAPPPRAFLRRSSHLPISGWFVHVGRTHAGATRPPAPARAAAA